MSGYASKAEVVDVVKATIRQNTIWTDLPREPKRFNIAGIVRENFYYAGRTYGWRSSTDANAFEASLRKNLRKQ